MVQLKTGIPFIAMGATAMILQIIVLRLLLSTFLWERVCDLVLRVHRFEFVT